MTREEIQTKLETGDAFNCTLKTDTWYVLDRFIIRDESNSGDEGDLYHVYENGRYNQYHIAFVLFDCLLMITNKPSTGFFLKIPFEQIKFKPI